MINKISEQLTAMQKTPIYTLIAVLIVIAILTISARLFLTGNETLSGGDSLWRLSINATSDNKPKSTIIKLYPPIDTPNIRTIQRNVSFPGFKIRKSSSKDSSQRSINVIATDTGLNSISANYLLHLSQTAFTLNALNTTLSTEKRESYLLDTEDLQFKSFEVRKISKRLTKDQPNQEVLLDKIYRYAKSIPISNGHDSINVPQILSKRKATIHDRALVMVSLARSGGIPARLVSGLILKVDIEALPHYWVEVYQNGQWSSYDVFYGYKNTLPHNYLPLRRNNKNMLEITKGQFKQVNYELEQEFNHPYLQKKNNPNITSVLNLTRLPVIVRDEIALLLLLPLGALITALFRHMVGVQSYGVFTPTLLALAIVYANLMTTLIVFIVVTFLAIGGRSVFPDTLTRIPRLSIIFTLIAVILTMSVSVLNYYDIDQGGKIILLPIIILTSLVDRFYRTIDDKGMTIALNRMAWTIFIALLCLPVIQFQTLGNLLIEFPEAHFITLALFLWLSVYKGAKLIELPLLKVFAEPKSTQKPKKGQVDAS